jgi:PIN domain nuclease of toxin-antitoxin system
VKLLLDTHIVLWWSLGDERLSHAGRAILDDERNLCVVSVASIWEIAIKSSLGRGLPLGITGERFADLIDEAGFTVQEIRKSHALGVEQIGAAHGDPFDRLIVSHAKTESLTLLTHDKILAAYGDFVLVV